MDISAPVGQKDRITKPDPKQKNQKFKPVANKREDVELVQLMLVANGFSLTVDGKCGSGTIGAIKSFQKSKLGFKTPDGIVDPGEKTWKAGWPKLATKIAADQKAVGDVVVVQEGGKEKYVQKSEFEREQEALRKKVLAKAEMMLGQAETWVDFCMDAEKTMQGADGMMQALTEFSVRWANNKAEPPHSELLDAKSEAAILKAYVSKGTVDWVRVQAQDKKATAAYNKGVKAFKAFIDARIGTASSIVGKLETVRDISFGVVEAYATAQLVARGRTPAQAHAIATGGTEALKNGASQLGEYLAGGNVTWKSVGEKVFLDSLISAAGSAAGGKISGGFANKTHDAFAKVLAEKLTSPAARQLVGVYCTKLLNNSFVQGAVPAAVKEVVTQSLKAVKSGKDMKEEEVHASIAKILSGGLTKLAPIKTLLGFEKTSPELARRLIADKLAPAVGNRVRLDIMLKDINLSDEAIEKLMKKYSDDVYKKIADKLQSKASEIMIKGVIKSMTTNEPESGLNKLAEQELRRNAELQKEIGEMIAEELRELAKKEKVGA